MKLFSIKKSLLISLIFYLISSSVQAFVDPSLYQGQLPVSDSSEQIREQVIPQILQQVLIKISGNPNVATLESIKPKITNASALVENYSYNYADNNELILTVQFDPKAIDQILSTLKNGVPLITSNHEFIVIIKGINNLDAYALVNQYFSSLNTVTKVENIGIGNNYVKLKITSSDELATLTNIINSGDKLAIVTPKDEGSDFTCVLK